MPYNIDYGTRREETNQTHAKYRLPMICLTVVGLYLSTHGSGPDSGTFKTVKADDGPAAADDGSDFSLILVGVVGFLLGRSGLGSGLAAVFFLRDEADALGVEGFLPAGEAIDAPAGLVAIIWRNSSSLMSGMLSSLACQYK